MPETDPYQVLGIGRGASGDEIRRAYRGLARKHHPDANPDDPGSEGRFKRIQQAYEVLSEPARRREYDRGTRPTGKRGSRGSGKAVRVDNLSYRRTDEQGEVGRELRADDLARFARILGIPLDRILKLIGENATVEGNVSFGGRRPGAAAGGRWRPPGGARPGRDDEKPPIPDKPPVPPKPPRTGEAEVNS